MRQVGTLTNGSDAERFSAYLVTQGITAHAESESDGWAIWVRDEDQLNKAKEEFEQFRIDPQASRYQGVEQRAESIHREEVQRREKMRKNVVVMGGRWKTGTARKAPLTFTLIALSVGVALWSGLGAQQARWDPLAFCQRAHQADQAWSASILSDKLIDIRAGQVWRLITPIFIHFGIMHLVFNMYCTYILGAQIEDRMGALHLSLLVLAIAIFSNLAQAVFVHPWFGGMSGVVYGLFGYSWMKSRFDPGSGIMVSNLTIVIFIAWFFLSMSNQFGPIANTAHGAGLLLGVVIGYFPILMKSVK